MTQCNLTEKKVKCTLVQAPRFCTGRTAHRGSRCIALPFNDHGTRRGWGVSVTPWPLFTLGKNLLPIVQETGWAPGSVWTGVENLASTGIRSPDRPARSQSLYRLRYAAHNLAEVYWYFTETCCLHLQSSQHIWYHITTQTIILETQLFYYLSKSFDQQHLNTIQWDKCISGCIFHHSNNLISTTQSSVFTCTFIQNHVSCILLHEIFFLNKLYHIFQFLLPIFNNS